MFYYPYELKNLAKIADSEEEILSNFKELSKNLDIYICTGSMAIKDNDKIFNRSYLINNRGEVILKHDKCHLFDVDLPDLRVTESETFTKGNDLNVVKTEYGRIGMLICYDIRFPEACRKLALSGAEIVIVPAAFNNITGPAHWHTIFRARAIENQLFLAAASPAKNRASTYKAYGHSMIIDPWGKILAEAGQNKKIIYAKLSPEVLLNTRKKLPLLTHRREEIY